MRLTRAFTLVELLVVIGIITVLAAIIFPVYARARMGAYRSSDISNMNTIRSALELYQNDQGGYPPGLLGYVNPYSSGPVDSSTVIPANAVKSALYPKRINNLQVFKPSLLKVGVVETTTAVWPQADPRPIGSAPLLDLNSDGTMDAADDPAQARQAYNPTDGYVTVTHGVSTDPNDAANFYKIDGYEVATVKIPGGTRTELRYAPFWTTWGLGGGNAQDDPRQLGYSDPPETTVIIWNSEFRDYENGVPDRRNADIVLFLGGGARNYDSRDMSERAWRVMP